MKKTLGEFLSVKPEHYPLTLYFNDFYYYENKDHRHLLMYIPSGKKTQNFHVSKKLNILLQLNEVFNLSLDKISIDIDNKYYYSASCDSEFLRTDDGTNQFLCVGTITLKLDWFIGDEKLSKGEYKKKRKKIEAYFEKINGKQILTEELDHPARPPTL